MELSPANSTFSLQIMQRAFFNEQDQDLTRSQVAEAISSHFLPRWIERQHSSQRMGK
jgi:hypothetical protein